jgi:ferredoxin
MMLNFMPQTEDNSRIKAKRKLTVSPNFTLKDDYSRFSERMTIFSRIMWDESLKTYRISMYKNIPDITKKNELGYGLLEHHLSVASWTVHDFFRGAFSWEKLRDPNNVMEMAKTPKYEINEDNIQDTTNFIKNTAKSFGASLVGVAPVDKRWIYTHDREGKEIPFPDWAKTVIAIAIEMEPYALGTSPSYIAAHASATGYSKMAFVISSLAEFIRRLGYKAIPSGNDTGLSIPIAISAGLGQLGRNGLLVTKEFGPRVRICKVFTNMPLVHDEPFDFGLTDVCCKCKKCAEACEVEAISFDDEPSFKVTSPSNNKGIYRWVVDVEKCYEFWIENASDCSTCITVCPFNLKTGGFANISPEEYWEKKINGKEEEI